MRQHFGVGLREKYMALGLQFGAQGQIVFDDAVVHHGHRPVSVEMRMGIHLRRLAVGGPARMANAQSPRHRLRLQRFLQVRQPPHPLANSQRAIRLPHRHAGRIISTVLQPLESLDQ